MQSSSTQQSTHPTPKLNSFSTYAARNQLNQLHAPQDRNANELTDYDQNSKISKTKKIKYSKKITRSHQDAE